MAETPLVVLAPLRIEARAVRRGAPGVTVHRTGMGVRRARQAGARFGALVPTTTPVAVVGLCGGLDESHRPGDVLVASELRTVDGSIRVELPEMAPLVAALRATGATLHCGPLVSSEKLSSGAAARAELWATGALGVDMESVWLAEGLRAIDPERPLVVVRVMSDGPGHELWSPGLPRQLAAASKRLREIMPVLEQWAQASAPRQVVLCAPRSFCAGVERAIDIVERAIDRFGGPVYVRRQIVHNTHVVRDLERKGAVFVHEVEEVPAGSTVVLAAHGVAPEVRGAAVERELNVIDATCPLVAKVHAEARRFVNHGYDIVLVGHADHEEVEGTVGESPDRITVVSTVADVDALEVRDPAKVAYLTQTTLAVDQTKDIVARLVERFPAIAGPHTDDICYATQNRQEAVAAVAAEADLVIVVGSANSSNSRRLAEVAQRAGARAHLVDGAQDLRLEWLAGARTIGLSAGASAPESKVAEVVSALRSLGRVSVEERRFREESVTFTLPPEVR